MEVHFTPDLEARIAAMAQATGRPADELVQDAIICYLGELAEVHSTLDRRYDDIKTGRVHPVDGELFFENLRRREQELQDRPAKR